MAALLVEEYHLQNNQKLAKNKGEASTNVRFF